MARPAGRSAVILLYHCVGGTATTANDRQVPFDEFCRQLQHVHRHYAVLPLDRLVAGLDAGTLPPRAVAITFDDGYVENLRVVAPIVREFDLPVTFFVTTEGLTNRFENWWNVVERVMRSDHPLPSHLDLFGDGTVTVATDTAAARKAAQRLLNASFFRLGADARRRAVTALVQWSGLQLTPRESHRVLMTAELQALARFPGVSIGAHSVHHLALTQLAPDERAREISDSKSVLETVLPMPIAGFAYPYGDCDDAAAVAVRSAGFTYAVTVRPGAATRNDDPWLLPRCEVRNGIVRDFEGWLAAHFRADIEVPLC